MILLTIVGDDISRIIPLLYTYRETIRHHILLTDDDPHNMQRAKMLQKGMQKFSAIHSLGWYTRILTTNEDSAEAITQSARSAFETRSELWLNVSDE